MSARLGSPSSPVAGVNTSISFDSRKKTVPGREFFVSRIIAAIFWSIVLQCVFVSFVLHLMNTDVLHPILWIKNTGTVVTSLGTWFYLCPLGVLTFAQGVFLSKDYVMGTPCFRTRFGILCGLLQPRSVAMATLSMIFGAMIVSYHSALLSSGSSFLTGACDSTNNRCLNERNLFLILDGLWVGLYVSLKQHLWETRSLCFPMVQQLKYHKVKTRLWGLILQSLQEAIWPTLYFSLLYTWRGSTLREHVCGALAVHYDEEPLDSLLAMIQPLLLLRTLLFSSVIILTRRTMEMLIQVHLTERCEFPINCPLGDRITLREALGSNLPLFQQLGYLDLLHLAECDPVRRAELFSLSMPGGHPHNWNAVSSEALKLLTSFTKDLNDAICDMNRAASGALLPNVRPNLGVSSPLSSPLSSPSQGPRLRNMSLLRTDLNGSMLVGSPQPPIVSAASVVHTSDIYDTVKQQVCVALEWVRRKPGISVLFGEMVDARARYLLVHSQHLSWAAQGLAQLTAASLTKDAYGVVQKDLPTILNTLLQLKCTLDRLPLHSHKRALRPDALDLRMKAALSSAVKRSLHIVLGAFGPYLPELPLQEDVRLQLANFVAYKES